MNEKAPDYEFVTDATKPHNVRLCPHCGHPMAKDLVAHSLPEVSRRIFETVQRAGSYGISTADIASIVYADDPSGGPVSNSVSVLISQQINPRIRKHGLVITARRGPGGKVNLRSLTELKGK